MFFIMFIKRKTVLMSLFILFGFIFIGYSGQAVVVNDDISVSFDEPLPFYFEEGALPEFFDMNFASNNLEVSLKSQFCNSLKGLVGCFSRARGIMGFFYCRGEWELKVEDLKSRVQNTIFAIPDKRERIMTDGFYERIEICRQKNTIKGQLFCVKHEVLKSSDMFYNVYECGELLLRVGQLRSSGK